VFLAALQGGATLDAACAAADAACPGFELARGLAALMAGRLIVAIR
jgi:hypothetical protein